MNVLVDDRHGTVRTRENGPMSVTELPLRDESSIDPDPFTIAIGIFSIMVGGGAFLEARRSREFMERQQRGQFRAAWFDARRALIYARRAVDEFETYALEDDFGRRALRFGSVHLAVDRDKARNLRRLRWQSNTTANRLADALDDLSNFLGPAHQLDIDAITTHLQDIATLPERYGDLIRRAREVIELYSSLLDAVAEAEGFEEPLPD